MSDSFSSLGSFALHVADLRFGLIATVLLVAAMATALVSLIQLVRSLSHDRLRQRVADLGGTAVEGTRPARPAPRRRPVTWYARLGAVIGDTRLVGATEQRRLAEKLTSAGLGGPGRVATLIAFRFLFALGGGLLVWMAVTFFAILASRPRGQYLLMSFGVAIGWRLPDMLVTWLARRRRIRLETGFPDALDLMVVCAEAGLALEQAMDRVAHDLRLATPEVAEEFGITAAEMRVVADRRVALENLAARTGLESLKGMISVLNQSIRFGTPLSDALRQLAAESRMVRMARIEERGARLSITLLLPIMVFVLPCMFLVIGGPVAIKAIDMFRHLLGPH
jgi:tight adherence protein C